MLARAVCIAAVLAAHGLRSTGALDSPFCTDTRGIRKSLDTLPRLFMANRPLWDISVDCSAVALAVLRTRPPVGEEGEEVGCADGAVVVERAKQKTPGR